MRGLRNEGCHRPRGAIRQQQNCGRRYGNDCEKAAGKNERNNCAAGVANAKAGVNRPSQNYYFFLDAFLAFFFAFFFAAIIVSLKLT